MVSGLENPLHWIVLLAIALIVLGPKRLPQVGRSLGHGIREFIDSMGGKDAPEHGRIAAASPPVPDETATVAAPARAPQPRT